MRLKNIYDSELNLLERQNKEFSEEINSKIKNLKQIHTSEIDKKIEFYENKIHKLKIKYDQVKYNETLSRETAEQLLIEAKELRRLSVDSNNRSC